MEGPSSSPVRLAARDPPHPVGEGDRLAGDARELGDEVPVPHRDAPGEPLADRVDGLADPAGEQFVRPVVALGPADGVDETLDGRPGNWTLHGDYRPQVRHEATMPRAADACQHLLHRRG